MSAAKKTKRTLFGVFQPQQKRQRKETDMLFVFQLANPPTLIKLIFRYSSVRLLPG